MTSYSVALTSEINGKLGEHLIRKDRQEDLCFATYVPSTGSKRFSGLLSEIVLPNENEIPSTLFDNKFGISS